MAAYLPFALLVLVADLYALIRIQRSCAAPERKRTWSAVVLLLPVIGVVAWRFFGPTCGGRPQSV